MIIQYICGFIWTRDGFKPNQSIYVDTESQKICSIVDSNQDIPKTPHKTVDFSSSFVFPGFIDCHVHLCIDEDDYQVAALKKQPSLVALESLARAQALLKTGFTTLRLAGEPGASEYVGSSLIKMSKGTTFKMPRITGAAHYFSSTGGGADHVLVVGKGNDGIVVDGVDEMQKAVRKECKYGAEWIKLLVSGCFMDSNGEGRTLQLHFTKEEVEMAVQEGKRRDVSVMAHAHTPESIAIAVEGGARSIEHGSFIDDRCIALCLNRTENPVWIVPTFAVNEVFLARTNVSSAQQQMVNLARETRAENIACIRKAYERGVKIAFGTDYVGWDAKDSHLEWGVMQEAGIPASEAVHMATIHAAELLKWDDRIGELKEGYFADFVVYDVNPIENVTWFERVKCVVKGGEIV